MPERSWHLITGEYPPQPGGVSDYCSLVAEALARSGARVHVWTRGRDGVATEADGVVVHRTGGTFAAADLARIDAELEAADGHRRLLVQYVPHAFGHRGMNLPFARWVARRGRRGDVVWTMFHEVRYVFFLRDSPRRWIVAAVTRAMARAVARASSRIYVTIPDWGRMVRALGASAPITWLPVPSTIPVVDDAAGVAAIRSALAPSVTSVVGSFGTYSPWIRSQLGAILPPLLEGHPDRAAAILGREGDAFASELLAAHPGLAGRVLAPGNLDRGAASLHLQACDLLVQPYPDGVSARRTSLMAAIAHGRAAVTTSGALTEPIWSESGAAALVPPGDPSAMTREAESLLADPPGRERLEGAARFLYEELFALKRTVGRLIADARKEDAGAR